MVLFWMAFASSALGSFIFSMLTQKWLTMRREAARHKEHQRLEQEHQLLQLGTLRAELQTLNADLSVKLADFRARWSV